MESSATRRITWIGMLGVLVLLGTGCSPTYVNFDGPQGTVLFVNDKPHHLPARVEFTRPGSAGQSNRYNIALVFPTTTGDARAEGFIDIYGYNESDVDRVATNTCTFDDTQLNNLLGGTVLVYKGKTASRQPLFDLTLSKK